jgi:hypothetical protein
MTLPASGKISISQVNTEIGVASTTKIDFGWVKGKTKNASSPFGMSQLYSKTYFKSSAAGNCNNGNCSQPYGTNNCGDGAGGNGNCINSAINCANCDASAYFQANCNCACTYNCSTALVYANCNCNCTAAC